MGSLLTAGQRSSSGGIRTVIDLRNDGERKTDASPRPPTITTILLPLDDAEDREFWEVWDSGPQFGTPLYYGPHLDRFPARSARVIAAIAQAKAGGVAFHCGGGRDRAGQIAMLVLALAGVLAEDIAADCALSAERLPARCAAHGEDDPSPILKAFLADMGKAAEDVIVDTLACLDVEACLRAGGLTDQGLDALRERLVGAEP